MNELIRAAIVDDTDVFMMRQRGREVAAVLGMDEQDQVRVATSMSEVSREVLVPGGGGEALFRLDRSASALEIAVTCRRPLPRLDHSSPPTGLEAARRLMDHVEVDEPGTGVLLVKDLPRSFRIDRHTLSGARAALAVAARGSPLDELRTQNAQLLAALDQLGRQKEELVGLNRELEETNRGVMAMYGQLSSELEETNRGVVALYAELDDRSEQLQRANESKTRFLSSVSHELRTPVNSVLALARLLLDPEGDPLSDDQRYQVELISSSASDLLQLVNDLLDLAKAEAGRLEPDAAPVALAPMFAELRGMLRPLVASGVSLEISEPVGLPELETDPALLARVLRNLLANAVKFTENGHVSMTARLDESSQQLEITVADTGIGIDPSEQARIFEPFYQVRGALQSRRRGTGLGLAYVKQVVEVLGGSIGLHSTPANGTVVSVVLPLRWSDFSTSQPVLPATAPAAHVDTALVVDDDPAFREALRGMLQGMAGRVLEAGSGSEALALAAATRPDVIFLDLRMPDIDGAEVAARLSSEPALRSVPVVIVTSNEIEGPERCYLPGRTLLAKSDLTRQRLSAVLSKATEEDRIAQ